MTIKIIAHRGLGPTSQFTAGPFGELPSGLEPENSLSSFEKSLEQGADGIECDVCPAKDNTPMVIHNNRLNKNVYQANRRTVELGFVHQLDLDELQAQKDKGYVYPLGNGQKIPSLQEVLDLVIAFNGKRLAQRQPEIVVNVELKRKGAAETAWPVIQDYIHQGKIKAESIFYCSFELNEIAKIRQLDKLSNVKSQIAYVLKTAFLYGEYHIIPPNWYVPFQYQYQDNAIKRLQEIHDKYQLDAIDTEYWDVEPALINFVQQNNIALHQWPSDKEPRVLNEGIVHHIVQLEHELKDILYKVDSPEDAVTYFTKVKTLYRDFSLENVRIHHVHTLKSIPANAFKYLSTKMADDEEIQLVEIAGEEGHKNFIILGMITEENCKAIYQKLNTGSLNLKDYLESILYINNDNAILPDVTLNVLRFYSKRYVGKPISI